MYRRVISLLVFLIICKLDVYGSEDYHYMDSLAQAANTDKSSSWHNYTRVYAKYFAPLKDQPIKFLEIGIHKGDSVKLWENYFTQAELHFIDITDSKILYHSDRSTYHFLDQSNVKQLKDFVKSTGGNYDIIIDDGGHTMAQQKISFVNLFPAVKNGGMYIIEDLHTSYWSIYGGGGTPEKPSANNASMTVFLQKLVDDVNFVGARTWCADHNKTPEEIKQKLNEYQRDIDSIHFYDSICVIIKR